MKAFRIWLAKMLVRGTGKAVYKKRVAGEIMRPEKFYIPAPEPVEE